MSIRLRSCLACLLVAYALVPASARAEGRAEIVQRGKKATALVDVEGREFGTAFCVDASGYFVTNAHVVRRAARAGKVTLVLDPGEANQRTGQAEVIRSDPEPDLALLRLEKAGGLTALAIGDATALVETTSVTAFGYPFGKLLAGVGAREGARPGANDYPSISVSTGRVTSLRKNKGELQLIQLDASLNPGNSGGPVLDEQGKVVGVVVSGVMGSGVNFAIPATKLTSFLDTPQISVQPPEVPFARRHDALPFVIQIVRFVPAAKGAAGAADARPAAVELKLRSARAGERTFTAKPDPDHPDTYRATAAPLPAAPTRAKVRVVATFASGSVTGMVQADLPLKVRAAAAAAAADAKATRTIHLADVRQVRGKDTGATDAPAPDVRLTDGTTVPGAPQGLDAVEMDLGGGVVAKLDLGKADTLEVAPPEPEDTRVDYTVIAKRGGAVWATTGGTITLESRPDPAAGANASGGAIRPGGSVGAATAADIRVPDLPDGRSEVKLPDTVDDVTVAGAGRYLLLTFKKLNKLGVFDVNAGRIVDYVPLPPNDVRVAAGREKLFIFLVDQRVVQRWNLSPLRRELTAPIPVEGVVQLASMGSAADGPLLLRWAVSTSELAQSKFEFFNPTTLRKIDAGPINTVHYMSYRDMVHVRASADGTTFGMWATSVSPTGLATLVFAGGKATAHYEHETAGHVVPGPDGRFIFTGMGGVYTDELRRVGSAGHSGGDPGHLGLACIPSSVSPGYYLTLPLGPVEDGTRRPEAARTPTGSVWLVGNDRPLTSLPALPEVFSRDAMFFRTDFTLDKRVHFLPNANLLITIPTSNDALVLRKFDVLEQLEKAGVDYLFVSSVPRGSAKPGQEYRYPIEVRSKRGGVRFKLESGPDGMAVSPAGVVTWRVPTNGSGQASVIITVKDDSGQEIFHTFTISYGDRPTATPNAGGAGNQN